MTKKIGIFIMIIFTFLTLGCKQSSVKQSENQVKTSKSDKTVTTIETKIAPANQPTQVTYQGTYKGIASPGPCIDFSVAVTGSEIKGTGKGTDKTGMVSCDLTLNGTMDTSGSMEGLANATYVQSAQGATFEWYLSGLFNGTLKDGDNNLIIQLKGAGHKCPQNVPCTDEPDTITVTLEKL